MLPIENILQIDAEEVLKALGLDGDADPVATTEEMEAGVETNPRRISPAGVHEAIDAAIAESVTPQFANYLPKTSAGEIHISPSDDIHEALTEFEGGARGTLYLGAGEYGITEPIVWRSGNRIIGCGTNYGASWRGTTIYPETGFPAGVPLIYSEGWGEEHLVQLVADAAAGASEIVVDARPGSDLFGDVTSITIDNFDQSSQWEVRGVSAITDNGGTWTITLDDPLTYAHTTGDFCYGETFQRNKWAHWSELRSFRIEGRADEGFDVYGIGANQGGEVSRLRDLFIRNCARHGIYAWGVSAPAHIDGCSVFFCDEAAVCVRNIFGSTGGLTTSLNNVRVWGLSGDSSRELLLIEGSGMVTALGLKCEGAFTNIVRLRPTNVLGVKIDGITVNRSSAGGVSIVQVDDALVDDYGLTYPYVTQSGRSFSKEEIDIHFKMENFRPSGFNFTNVWKNDITDTTRAFSTSPREYFFGTLHHNWLVEELL